MTTAKTRQPRAADAGAPDTGVPAGNPVWDVDDALLVARAADGDTRAFEVLVRRYGRLVRAYARSILGSSDGVDDVVQEAFVIAWQQLETVKEPQKMKSWLMRITSRRALDRLRATHPHERIDDQVHPASAAEEPSASVQTRLLVCATEDALEMLPLQQRRCWILKVVGGLSYREIADELQLPESTVRGLIARSRATMAQEMAAWR